MLKIILKPVNEEMLICGWRINTNVCAVNHTYDIGNATMMEDSLRHLSGLSLAVPRNKKIRIKSEPVGNSANNF